MRANKCKNCDYSSNSKQGLRSFCIKSGKWTDPEYNCELFYEKGTKTKLEKLLKKLYSKIENRIDV